MEYKNISTIDANTTDGAVKIFHAIQNAESMKNMEGKPFTIVGIYIENGERSQTGAPCANTYLILEDGSAVFSQSDGVYNDAVRIYTMFGAILDKGITVETKQRTLASGRTLRYLDIVS